MKQCRVDAFVVGPKKREFFGCYEWICIRCVSEGKRRRYFQLDYRSFWSMVDDNFCIVDMHKGNFADFFRCTITRYQHLFLFCGTEPSPQSKRRTRGHRRLIQASSFDTKQTFNTTQKPFKSSDFCTNVFLFQGCPSPPPKKKHTAPSLWKRMWVCFHQNFPFFVWMPKKPTPLDSEKSGCFFINEFLPIQTSHGRSMVALRCAPPRWRAWPEPTKWWQVPPSSGHRIWGGPLGRALGGWVVVMGLGAC